MTIAIPQFPITPVIPDGYSVLDASALQAASRIEGAPVIAVVGDCRGGQPNAVLEFTNPGQLKGIARSGPAYDAARAAFAGGASKVILVRVGTPTQSSAALAGATGTPVTLTSLDWGVWTASIKRTIEANNKVTISYTNPSTGETFTEVYAVGASATAQQVVDAVNGVNPQFQKSRYASAAATTGTMPLTTATQAVLTTAGTDDGSIDAGDWTAGFTVLETATTQAGESTGIVCVATGDATVHAQAAAHCDAMSATLARKERTTVVGAVLAEAVSAQVTRIGNLRNKRVQLVYPGIWMFSDAGSLTLYAPYVAAAFTAGKHAALPDVATSLVGANLGSAVVDVEKRFSSIPGGELEQLLLAGVTPIGADPSGGFEYVDSLSGYIADYAFRDFHKIRAADYSAKFLRESLIKKFKGRKTSGLEDEIKTAANTFADQLVAMGIIVGHLAADAIQDPSNGTATHVSVPIALPDVNKYILLTVALQPASALTQTQGA